MIKSTYALAIVAALGFASVAYAADAPVYQDQAATVEAANKSGLFGEVTGGIAGTDLNYGADVGGTPLEATLDGWGGAVGGAVGYQLDLNGLIIGALVSGEWMNVDGQVTLSAPGLDATVGSEIDSMITARGKLGYAIGSATPYVTGGWAWTSVTTGYDLGPIGSDSFDTDHSGFVIGAGIDFDVTENIYLGIEALYTDQDEQVIWSDAANSVTADPDVFEVKGKAGVRFNLF